MAKLLSRDLENHCTVINQTAESKRKVRNEKIRERKIARLLDTYPNVDTDRIEEWVNEDIDEMEFRDDESKQFLGNLEGDVNMAIKAAGTRYYNPEQRIGRIWKRIHENNIRENKSTILIFRSGDPIVYRLGVPSGKEIGILHNSLQDGGTVSRIKVAYNEVN